MATFFVNKDGDLVLGMGDDYKSESEDRLLPREQLVSISTNGKITTVRETPTRSIGAAEVVCVINPQGLNVLQRSIFYKTRSQRKAHWICRAQQKRGRDRCCRGSWKRLTSIR